MPCTRSVKYISNSFGAESLVGLEDKGQRFTGLDLLDELNLQPLQAFDISKRRIKITIRLCNKHMRVTAACKILTHTLLNFDVEDPPEDRRDSAQLHHSVLLMC